MALTSVIALLACILFVIAVLFHYFNTQVTNELKSSITYISEGIEENGLEYLNKLDAHDKRITYIAADGTVTYDNTVADVSLMENHLDREEVLEAIRNGTGESTRASETLTKRTVYHAVRLSDGSILRLSDTQSSTTVIIAGITQPILLIGAIIFIISAIVSSKISHAITEPLNSLDISNPSDITVYDELKPLIKKLDEQNTTIKRQIADLKRKQTEFDTITKNMSEGFIIIDSFRNILSFNPAAPRLLGGDTGREYKSISELTENETVRHAVIEALAGNHFEDKFFLGETCCQIIASPVNNEVVTVGAIILILDISEKNQRETMRHEFTANVSHELKTPLTSISGFAELMMNGMVKETDIPDFSATIYKESRRLITLVNDIIKISELDSRNAYEKDELDLYDVCDEVVSVLTDAAEHKNLSLELVGESAIITGVKQIVFEMIYNICDNAIKYNKENGSVKIELVSADGKATVTVKDTGIGIPYDHQSRVFERFYRVDKSHSKQTGGTGLGLSIVKHGAIFHDAEIHLESTPGVGTEISITFKLN